MRATHWSVRFPEYHNVILAAHRLGSAWLLLGLVGCHASAPTAPGGVMAGGTAGTGANAAGAVAADGGHAGVASSQPAADGGASGSMVGTGMGGAGAPAQTDSDAGEAGAGSPPSTVSGDLVVSPDGKDSAAGTMTDPTTLTAALPRLAIGHVIYLRAGNYVFNVQLTIEQTNSGTLSQPKQLLAYGDEKPVLDFSSQPYGTGSNPRGLQINGSYWHVKGLTVQGAADNGMYIAGNHNVIENCVIHGNRDTGLQLGRIGSSQTAIADWPSENLILNCESYDNYDAPPGAGENADGFAAKLTVGTGNVFRGCVSHNNIDDGWDLYTKPDTGPIGTVTIDQCISHHNGTLTDGTTNANGDRNGFKLGGEKIAVKHLVTRSIAFSNGAVGFTWNSNPGAIQLSNTLAFDNVAGNYNFGNSDTTTSAVFTNNVSFWTKSSGAKSDKTLGMDVSGSNCWWTTSGSTPSKNPNGLSVSAADFAMPLDMVKVIRAADGSPNLVSFKLATGSDLINVGVVPAGMLPFDATYYQGKPDLGAVETQ